MFGIINMDASRATYACLACRTQKRKCTRELPACAACLRSNKTCEYSATNKRKVKLGPMLTTAANGLGGQEGPEPPPPTTTRYFLDSDSHQPAGYSIAPRYPVPETMFEFLAHVEDYQPICDAYFSSIQPWLPFLSEKATVGRLQENGPNGSLGLTLLLLSMRLASTTPDDLEGAVCSPLYQKTIELSSWMERLGFVCLELLQSAILISVYEIGHGIYPAAFTSVGRAARLGQVLGLHDRKNAPQLFKSPNTWTLREEERRAWWAVIIMDRYVNLGIVISLAAPNPNNGDLLPCTEERWKEGHIGINEPLLVEYLSKESNIGVYANTCQAAHITGRVLEHRTRSKTGADHRSQVMEGQQLHLIITALSTHLFEKFTQKKQDMSENRLTAVALCGSARLILANIYGCNEHYPTDNGPRLAEETTMQEASIRSIEEMIDRAYDLGECISSLDDRELASCSPVVCHFLYQAASECAWVVREFSNHAQKSRLNGIVRGLMALQNRWRIVVEYLRLLKAEGIWDIFY